MGEKGIDAVFHAALEYEIRKGGRGAQARLAKAIGKTPTYVNDLLKRKAYGSEATRREIAKVFGYDYEDFLDIGRQILKDRGEAIEPRPRIWKRESASASIVLLGELETKPGVALEDYYAAPLIDGAIAAGPGRVISETEVGSLVWIYAPELRHRQKHNLVALKIDGKNGDSMLPTLCPGDIVLVDRDDPGSDDSAFIDRKIYAVRDGQGGAAVKRLYRSPKGIVVYSDNREVPPEIAWTGNIAELIIGRVVWGWRNLLDA